MRCLRVAAIVTGGLLVGTRALADDGSELELRRTRAFEAIQSTAADEERGNTLLHLAQLDGADAAKALVECMTETATRRALIEDRHRRTLEAYAPFSGYTFKTSEEWDTKRKLVERIMQEETELNGLGALTRAGAAAVASMSDPAAVAALQRAGTLQGDARSRAAIFSGLLLNPAAASAAPSIAAACLRDSSVPVRLAALDAVATRKDAKLLDLVVKVLKERTWPVRQAAVRALEAMHDVRAVPPLVAAMQSEEGAVLEDYARALTSITGAMLGVNADAWSKWCEEHKAELAAGGVKPPPRPKVGTKAVPPTALHYYGVETLSRRVVFVVDISASMKEPIGETTGTGNLVFSGPKIEIARRMLLDAVAKLAPGTTFDVISFNHLTKVLWPAMTLATPEAKAEAEAAIQELQPSGSTWAYGALRRAFALAEAGDDRTAGENDPKVDTIFFVSDGAPTDDSIDQARPMKPEVILSAVREWNRLARIRVHTIAIDPRIGKDDMIRFMRGLAEITGGTYTEIGTK